MGGGRLGEMVTSDPPGSYGAMGIMEKMSLDRSMRELGERRKLRERHEKLQEIAQLLGNEVTRRTTENQGENDD